VVAAEVVLCHPPLSPGEVRAVATPTDGGVHRLTLVAADHPGLLAGTAGVLATEGLSIVDATTTVLPSSRLALQRIAVAGGDPAEEGWQRIGARLRQVLGTGAAVASSPWRPTPPVTVETQPQASGRAVVTVRAPDRPGLLHAIATWLTGEGCNIESCHASSRDGTATDVLVVAGHVDPAALAAALGGQPAQQAHGGMYPLRLVVGTAVGLGLLPWRLSRAAWELVADHR
jgi:[protein-PII] uridylyltransferase